MPVEADLERDGFAIVPEALDEGLVEHLASAIAAFSGGDRRRGIYARGHVYALRNLFDLVPETRTALESDGVRSLVGAVLGSEAICVRAVFFARPPRSTGRIPWRQDATVVVKERAEVTGFGPWSTKAGLHHVMAPPGTLAAMLTLRLHLDGEGESASIRVVPSSHQYGRLPEDSIGQFTRYGVADCALGKRAILAMRPLLLRTASAGSGGAGPRRVIQLDFSARRLPLPLEWRDRYPLF